LKSNSTVVYLPHTPVSCYRFEAKPQVVAAQLVLITRRRLIPTNHRTSRGSLLHLSLYCEAICLAVSRYFWCLVGGTTKQAHYRPHQAQTRRIIIDGQARKSWRVTSAVFSRGLILDPRGKPREIESHTAGHFVHLLLWGLKELIPSIWG
jgi:hypothetical protein